MARSVVKTVLVIGDNYEDIIKKYSLDTKVDTYIKYKREDSSKRQKKHLNIIKEILNSDLVKLTENQKEIYEHLYQEIKEMDEFEYYLYYTQGCHYDEETGDALSEENPNAFYRAPQCYQKRFVQSNYQDEAPFSNPFKLKDGTKSYVAKFEDIDWSLNHMYNTKVYESAWEVIVEGREPENDIERQIYDSMSNRLSYFDNFTDKEDYVTHSCSFWTFGVATENEYVELDYTVSDKIWKKEFFNRFIKTIKGNPTLSIYEVRSLND